MSDKLIPLFAAAYPDIDELGAAVDRRVHRRVRENILLGGAAADHGIHCRSPVDHLKCVVDRGLGRRAADHLLFASIADDGVRYRSTIDFLVGTVDGGVADGPAVNVLQRAGVDRYRHGRTAVVFLKTERVDRGIDGAAPEHELATGAIDGRAASRAAGEYALLCGVVERGAQCYAA